jgi:2-methylcitrate dehydratase PrpD
VVSRAWRSATTLLLTPSYTNTVAGATTLNVAGGMSGYVGAFAPELVLAGFAAQDDAIEEALGKMVGEGFRADGLLEELGTRWEIQRNYFRLYACCNPIHPALDCLKAALAALAPRPEEIERIDFVTYRFASVMRNPDPSNFFASRYSLPHAAAVMVARGAIGHGALDDSAVTDPVVGALRHRVTIAEDPAMTALVPRLRPARVTVTLKDGRRATHAVQSHRGDFNDPFAESEIRAKFHELAGHVLTPDGTARIEMLVDRCESWNSVPDFIEQLRRHTRP